MVTCFSRPAVHFIENRIKLSHMILNTFLIFASIAMTLLVLVSRAWRWEIFGLSALYLVGFVLIIQIWPFTLAAVKLMSGLMSVALLSTVKVNVEEETEQDESLSSRIFVFLLACLTWIIVTATVNDLNEILPISYTNLYTGMIIVCAGILKVSLNQKIFDIVIGLLVFLAGFDIIYSSLEGSALVTGFYSLINLLICVIGSYLEGGFRRGIEQ